MSPALPLALGAGVASAFSPCGIAMLPATVGLLLSSEHSAASGAGRRALRAVSAGLLLSLGFASVVALAAFSFSLMAHAVERLLPVLMTSLAAALFVAGILMTLNRLSIGLATGRVSERLGSVRLGVAGTLLATGAAYGLAALGCTLPLFVALVAEAASSGWQGAALVTAAFSVGVALVLTGVALGTAAWRTAMEAVIRKVVPYLPKASGIIVTAAGLWIGYYWLFGPGRLPST